jgi:RNA polymerase sigma factor (sigma-70 family)
MKGVNSSPKLRYHGQLPGVQAVAPHLHDQGRVLRGVHVSDMISNNSKPVERSSVPCARKGGKGEASIQDATELLFRQVGRERYLNREEEGQLSRTLIENRSQFLQHLLSFPVIARSALESLKDVIASGNYTYLANIVDLGANQEPSEVVRVVSIAQTNSRTVEGLLQRCNVRWAFIESAPSVAVRERVLQEIRADHKKIGVLLAEIPMRPSFTLQYHAPCEELVSVVKAGNPDAPEVSAALGGAQSTREDLLATWNGAEKAHATYIGAKNVLVTRNIALAVFEANRFLKGSLPKDDLVQEGITGLMIAAEKFGPERGLRFTTYATQWIRQAVYRFIDNHSRTVRVPGNVQNAIRKVEEYRLRVRGHLGREVTPEEIEREFQGKITTLKVNEAWTELAAPAGRPEISLSTQRMRSEKNVRSPADLLGIRGKSTR